MIIRPVKDISSADLQELLNNMAKGKIDDKNMEISQASIKSLRKYLKRLFSYLSSEGYCHDVSCNLVLPKIASAMDNHKIKQIEVFTDEEIKKIITTPNRKQFMFQLALATGLRAGEILALKYTDIEDGNVKVSKQLNNHYAIDSDGYRQYVNVIKKPKSTSSVRTVPIPDNIQKAFEKYKTEHMAEMLRNGYRTEFLFTSESGKLLDKGNLRVAWVRHLKRAGIPYKKFHCCRSTYCTILCRQGVSLETARKLMGHSDINVTAEFYRFIGQPEMKKAAEKIDNLFSIQN